VQERGNVTPGRVAVEIPQVTGTTGDPDWDALKGGINDLMMVDVMQARDDCGTTLIEVERRAELIRELEFQQSPYVDPATRHTRNLALGDVELRGTISRASRGGAKVAMTMVDKRTGAVLGSRETTLDRTDWPDQLETLAKQVADDLCKLSDVYEVTLDISGTGRFATHSGTGTIHTTLRAAERARPRGLARHRAAAMGQRHLRLDDRVPDHRLRHPGDRLVGDDPRRRRRSAAGDVDAGRQRGDDRVRGLPRRSRPTADPRHGGRRAAGGDGFFNTGTITVRPAGVG
jgi:hypothetical protein